MIDGSIGKVKDGVSFAFEMAVDIDDRQIDQNCMDLFSIELMISFAFCEPSNRLCFAIGYDKVEIARQECNEAGGLIRA